MLHSSTSGAGAATFLRTIFIVLVLGATDADAATDTVSLDILIVSEVDAELLAIMILH